MSTSSSDGYCPNLKLCWGTLAAFKELFALLTVPSSVIITKNEKAANDDRLFEKTRMRAQYPREYSPKRA